MRIAAALIALVTFAFAPALPVAAQEAPAGVKGLFLLTDYPAVTVRPGTASTVNLRLQNYALPPERLALARDRRAVGLDRDAARRRPAGGGRDAGHQPERLAAASRSTCRPAPRWAPQTLTVTAKGGSTEVSLPVAVTLAKELPAKLTVEPQLPSLRGNAKSSFEYQLNVKNDSGRNLVVGFSARRRRRTSRPPSPSSTAARRSTRCRSRPASPRPSSSRCARRARSAPARYPVTVKATAEDATADAKVALEIAGQPRLSLAGRDGLVSSRAEAGKETSIPILITNTGTAPADEVELTSTAPSGWKIVFEPKTIDRIPPGQNKEVQALVTPPEKAMAGDYAPTFNVASRGETASHAVPRRGFDLDHVGHRRRRHHRHRAADHGRSGCEVRPAMSDTVIEASGLTKRYGDGHGGRRRLVHDPAGRDLRPARVRTAPARPPPS